MTLQQLKYAVTVAETGSITEAAKKLFISQPSLTNAVHDLEREMHVVIFQRTNKGIHISKEGEQFLGYARQVLEQASILEDKYKGGDGGKKQFCVSTQHYSFAVNAFVDLIKQYGQDEYDFSLRETQTYEIIEDVAQMKSELEIGIASWNAPPEKVLIYAGFRGFENEKIFEFSPSVLPIFQSGLGEDTTWRVVRVVEGATLEKSCAARHLGFESLTLRQPEKPVLPASLFYSRFPIPKPASIASAEITFELYSRCA